MHYATNRQVVSSIPDCVLNKFPVINIFKMEISIPKIKKKLTLRTATYV